MIPYFSLSSIQVGPIALQMWGLFASLGVLFSLFISLNRAKKIDIDKEVIYDTFLIALIAFIAGAKMFYIIFSAEKDISVSGLISGGGFSFLGGAIFSGVTVFSYLTYKKVDVLKIADILTPGFAVALIFIRIGCFLVYDHIGSITDLPWGIAYSDGSVRHPVSLYLLLGNIVIFWIIWYLEKRKTGLAKGAIFFISLALYSAFRFIFDFTRCADLGVCDARYFGLTYTQLLLSVIFPVSVYLLMKTLTINKKNEQN